MKKRDNIYACCKKRKETKMDLFRKKFIEIFGEGLAPYG